MCNVQIAWFMFPALKWDIYEFIKYMCTFWVYVFSHLIFILAMTVYREVLKPLWNILEVASQVSCYKVKINCLRLGAFKLQNFNVKWLWVLNLSWMDLSCFSNSSLLSLSYTPEGKHRNCERKCNVPKHDTIAPGVFKPEPLDPESHSLTIQWIRLCATPYVRHYKD